jgi:hypothetical protein
MKYELRIVYKQAGRLVSDDLFRTVPSLRKKHLDDVKESALSRATRILDEGGSGSVSICVCSIADKSRKFCIEKYKV